MGIKKKVELVEEGDFRTEIETAEIDGIEIDHYAVRKIYEKGILTETITEERELPDKVRPPERAIATPPPGAKKMMLVDNKDPFWTLDKKVTRDITVYVKETEEGETILTDAVTGKEIGKGIPAPATKGATAISGYCQGYNDPWKPWRENALYWYQRLGFGVWNTYAPSKSSVGTKIRNPGYRYHYALAHGDYNRFQVTGREWVTASDVASWMAGGSAGDGGPGGRPAPARARKPFTFAFLGQCGAFTKLGPGTMTHAFMKGQTRDTVCIGYYNAHLHLNGWRDSLNWQSKMFSYVNAGNTWKYAFDRARSCYPNCRVMTRFIGDSSLKAHPAGGYDDGYEEGSGGDDSGDSGGDSGEEDSGGGGPDRRGRGSSGGSGSQRQGRRSSGGSPRKR